MKHFLRSKEAAGKAEAAKREVSVQGGVLLSVLRPGIPLMYQYMGNVVQTSTVQSILEVAENHVIFETMNSIYTVSWGNAAAAGF